MPASRPMHALAAAALLTAAPAAFANETAPIDPATRTAIEATCFDYVDGQLEGDPARVARSLHPDLAKRSVLGETADEKLGLRRMSKEELVELTRRGALKTPKAQWDRSCAAARCRWSPSFHPVTSPDEIRCATRRTKAKPSPERIAATPNLVRRWM